MPSVFTGALDEFHLAAIRTESEDARLPNGVKEAQKELCLNLDGAVESLGLDRPNQIA
jgi:hypothetical protein